MPGKRPNEPIGPTNVPGQRLDPKIPPEKQGRDQDRDRKRDRDTEVTPLDEDKNIEDGIEVDEK